MSVFRQTPNYAHTVWGLMPQFGQMTDADRKYWRGTLNGEFGSLAKQHGFLYVAVPLYPTKRISIKDLHFDFPTEVAKGIAVRLACTAILHFVDNDKLGPAGRSVNWIIMVDGTGAYENQLSNVMVALEKAPVAIALRMGRYRGMSDERVDIETFENHLLENAFGQDMPDCQGGIWGVRVDVLRDIVLTAASYGLEYDLAAGVLQTRTRFEFAPVTANPNRALSTFKAEESLNKLRFIVQRLGLTRDTFLKLWSGYPRTLPKQYMTEVNQLLDDPDPFRPPLFLPDSN